MKNKQSIIHFVGLGGAGCNVLETFYRRGIKARYTCITDPERKHLPKDIHSIHYCSPKDEAMRGTLADMSVPLVLPENVKAVFSENHKYVLLAGLGSYTGTYMVEELNIWLKENNKDFMSICSIPFRFEGDLRTKHAERLKNKLQSLPNFKYFELDILMEKFGEKSFPKGLKIAADEMYKLFKYEIEKQS